MNSCIYEGLVRHRRFSPVANAFSYRLFQLFLDLDELPGVFRGRWLWSASRPAVAWFRRQDHSGNPCQPLAETARNMVEAHTGSRPLGPVRLLTHLRYFGYCMNPVSFYYCYAAGGETLAAIIAEINNTPWGERHCYVLSAATSLATPPHFRWIFSKEFHVSPFMRMEQSYDWRFTLPGQSLAVHMENFEAGQRIFDATLTLTRREITTRNLNRVLLHYPFMTGKVIAAIYYQAARLWLKRCPFVPHPNVGKVSRTR
jgi:DUF1365 family protein